MYLMSGSVKQMSIEIDGISMLHLLTDRRKPFVVTVKGGVVRIIDDEVEATVYEGKLMDSEITFHPENSYIVFESEYAGIPTAYRLEFNLTTRAFFLDSKGIVNLK